MTSHGHDVGDVFPVSDPEASPVWPGRSWFSGEDWLDERYRDIARDLNDRISLKEVRVVLVGDSLTQLWGGWDATHHPLWSGTFGQVGTPLYALNLGVSGDRTENVLLRLLDKADGGFGHLDDIRIQPEVIVLMIGINNVFQSTGPVEDKVLAGNLAILHRLRALRPQATIVLQALLPTKYAPGNDLIRSVNRALAQASAALAPSVVWLDLYRDFVDDDGVARADLYRDDVHLGPEGYRVWAEKLLPVLDYIQTSRIS